jgi:membrane protease YdiL (CAAX protease family)
MRSKPIIALLLLVPAPSIGVLSAMIWWPETTLGSAIFSISKLWRGLVSGLAISVIISLAYLLLGERLIDFEAMRAGIATIGLDKPLVYLGGALYWITVNSLLEEYVWRWFVGSKSMDLLGKPAGVFAAAIFFTLHHVIALSVFMDVSAVILCSAGIFVGGVVWSYMYARFESIWPGYLSHAIVDLCVFGLGAIIIFGA